ncbi:MAG: glucuronate isomerase, partial [Pseudomonadota bacterium]|nr:glucuronate isomerase [Pseudomonadota bacterium]
MESILLHEDRLFPADEATRSVAKALYKEIRDLPIISPHGHTDPRWFAQNNNFTNATELFITPDHYVFRMLYSQGIKLTDIGVPRWDGGETEKDPRKIWKLLADNYHLFAATP